MSNPQKTKVFRLANFSFRLSAKTISSALPNLSYFWKALSITVAFVLGHNSYAQSNHSMIITNNGSLYAFGKNSNGQLGVGNKNETINPSRVDMSNMPGNAKVAQVSTSAEHTLILTTDGKVYACGLNDTGAFGFRSQGLVTITTPYEIRIPNNDEVVQVSAGDNYSLILTINGEVYATGWNQEGQLGIGSFSSQPTFALTKTGIDNVVQISAGAHHSLFLKINGEVYACGSNSEGQLGIQYRSGNQVSPGKITIPGNAQVVQISAGHKHSLFLTIDGDVYATGYNNYGQLGINNNTSSITDPTKTVIDNVSQISAGGNHSLFLKTDGSVYATGYNNEGQLGDGNNTDRNAPHKILESKVVQVSAGSNHSLILKNDGSVHTFGHNEWGQLGDGNKTDRNTPYNIGAANAAKLPNQVLNWAPVITQGDGPLTKTINEDNNATWTASELKATDPDGNASSLEWSLLSSPTSGTANVEGNGSSPTTLSYSPDLDYNGSDSFSVLVSDGENNDSITIHLTINQVNDLPSIIGGDSTVSLQEDSPATGDLNATDVENRLSANPFSITTNGTRGTATIDQQDGNWTYSPNPNEFGSDFFIVKVTDLDGGYATQKIDLTINSVNDPTTVTGDTTATLQEDETATGDLNATDADGLTDGTYFSIETNATDGTASIDPVDGNWTYSPKPYFYGTDSFGVSVTDDFNVSTIVTLELNITEVIEYHVPVVETGQPEVDSTGFLTLSGNIRSDGGKQLLEVGFLLSPTLDFNQSERLVARLDSPSGAFLLEASTGSALYVRAFASNAVGESLGQVVALESPSSESSPWADAQTLPGGWLQSDWLGTFKPYENGWIFHTRLGWLYVPASDDDGLWMWSSIEEWIWTQNGIAPYFFDHGAANWLYLLPAGEHGKTFYDYSIENVR